MRLYCCSAGISRLAHFRHCRRTTVCVEVSCLKRPTFMSYIPGIQHHSGRFYKDILVIKLMPEWSLYFQPVLYFFFLLFFFQAFAVSIFAFLERTEVDIKLQLSCLREFLYSDSYTRCSPGFCAKNFVGTNSVWLLVVCFLCRNKPNAWNLPKTLLPNPKMNRKQRPKRHIFAIMILRFGLK